MSEKCPYYQGVCMLDESYVCFASSSYRNCELFKEEEDREYQAQVEYQQYCEHYEPTYNPEDGSM